MTRSNYLPTLSCLLFLAFSTQAQESLKYPLAVIRSQGEEGEETGAGVLIGQKGETLCFITAAHVVADPNSITVQLYKGATTGGKLEKSNQPLDIAVLSCEAPAGYKAPPSFALAKSGEKNLQSVIVAGHPLGNYWDINFNSNVKNVDFDLDDRLFTLAPIGIAPGNSGGPVLTQQYEFLGLITKVDQVNAVCVDAATILKACQSWQVPTNLMTGIVVEEKTQSGQEDFRYQLFSQEGNTAFQSKKWQQAKTAFEQAVAIVPSDVLKNKIELCKTEIARDESYQKNLNEGKRATDLSTALGFYLQSQKQRDTDEVRNLIKQTKERLAKMDQLSAASKVATDQLPPKIMDSFAGSLILVRGGTFSMGCDTCKEDEYPAHQVFLDDYYMAAQEVTVEQYVTYLNEVWSKELHTCWMVTNEKKGVTYQYKPEKGAEKKPAVLHFPKILEYCQWLSEKSGYIFRLPTEAEWEYAAAGGQKRPASFNSSKATVLPNPLGITNLFGSREEYCSDWYLQNYFQYCKQQGTCTNPDGPPVQSENVLIRGGKNRFYHRNQFSTSYPGKGLTEGGFGPGFRLVRSLYPQKLSYEAKLASLFEKNMVFVKGGQFSMGDTGGGLTSEFYKTNRRENRDGATKDNILHEVIVDDFYIAKTEVTEYQWNAVMKREIPLMVENNNKAKVDYYSAVEFIKKINTLTSLKYRLPTEAEWEYAARGGHLDNKTTIFAGSDNLENGPFVYPEGPSKPGITSTPNELGLYFMSSDVFEWCMDWYNVDYYQKSPLKNPTGPSAGWYNVIRGGQYTAYPSTGIPVYERWFVPLGNSSLSGLKSDDLKKVGIRLAKSTDNKPVTIPKFNDPFKKDLIYIKGGIYQYYDGYNYEDIEVKDFEILKYEVTQEQFKMLMGYLPEGNTCDNCPMVNFTQQDIERFFWSIGNYVETGKKYRLPTKTELNFIIENDEKIKGSENEKILPKYANLDFKGNASSRLLPIGSLLPNELGIFDLLGNASELCWDDIHGRWEYTEMGGSYLNKRGGFRFAYETGKETDPGLGFRVVLVNKD